MPNDDILFDIEERDETDNSLMCSTCKSVMITFGYFLKSGQGFTHEQMMQFIHEICFVVPSTMTAQCREMMAEFGTKLLENVLD